jgi:hypothetical protein
MKERKGFEKNCKEKYKKQKKISSAPRELAAAAGGIHRRRCFPATPRLDLREGS